MIPTPDLVEQCARIADHCRAIAESEALDADTRDAAAVLTGRCLALAGRTLDDIERAEGASETGEPTATVAFVADGTETYTDEHGDEQPIPEGAIVYAVDAPPTGGA